MEPLFQAIGEFFLWVLKNTVQASALILIVLLAQWLFRNRLSPFWRHALWLLVLVRLLVPVAPQSSWSLFNFPRLAFSQLTSTSTSTDAAARSGDSSNGVSSNFAPATIKPSPESGTAVVNAESPPPSEGWDQTRPIEARSDPASPLETSLVSQWPMVLGVLWLLGAFSLGLHVVWVGWRFGKQLASHHDVVNPAISDVLAEAQEAMAVRRVLPVVQSRVVGSPALMGFIRPWLLLPEGITQRFTPEELRFVFLHELSHLKRRDILVNWLMTGALVMHWFNPLVWLAFNRMRADRELACDAQALARASHLDRRPYGQAMIKLLEDFTRPWAAAHLVGILEERNLMKRRITMIKHDSPKGRWPWLAPALLCILGLTTFTDAVQTHAGSAKPAAQGKAGLNRRHQGSGSIEWHAVSPDGKLACFTDWATGSYGYLNLEDDTRVSLVSKVSWDKTQDWGYTGAFSPDGNTLAYVWVLNKGGEELRLANTDTGKSRVLLNRPRAYSIEVHDWSPNTDSLLVLKDNGNNNGATRSVALVNTKDGRITQEYELNLSAMARLRMSPNGRYVAFGHHASPSNRDGEISLIDLENGNVKPLVAHSGEDYPLDWSAKGDRLFFVSDRRGDWDIWTIPLVDGEVIDEPKLRLASAGKINALCLTDEGALHYSMSVELKNVLMMSLLGQPGSRWKLESTGQRLPRAYQGAWSHDGRQFAFLRKDPGEENAKLCVRTSGPTAEQTFDTGLPHYPLIFGLQWSSDHRAVRYLYKEVKLFGIHELVLDQGKPERIDKKMRAISPDGRLIADPKKEGLELVDRETGERKRLLEHDAPVNRIRVVFSPSGEHIAYLTLGPGDRPDLWLTDGSTLWVTPVVGGRPKAILHSEGSIGTPVWLPDEEAVLCATHPKAGEEGSPQWWRVPCNEAEPEPIELELNGVEVRSMCVHPDGKQVAVETHEEWTELWVAEGLGLSDGK